MESKHKHRILLQLMQQPRRFFSTKELAFRTSLTMKRVKTLLAALAKQHLVLRAEKRQTSFYRINQHAASFEQLRSIFTAELKMKRKVKSKDFIERVLLACGDVKFAALSGVFIGLVKSSVDLLLVGDISTRRIERAIQILQRIIGIELNYALFSEKEFRNRQYSFDWFVKEILERDPIILVDRASKHGERY
ncbi:MAG TPA: hypothetical protein VJK50_04425, partial [Patescibacteria group bacterium]|nr:hypothetical protein [Patescibacteria group bacterium]